MIEAVEVVREKDGSFTHPEWEALLDSLGDMEHLPRYIKSLFEKSHGCTIEVVTFEGSVDEDSPAYQEYVEEGGGFALWELEKPTAGAVLLSIHDTEDGPVQWWAVPVVCAESLIKKLAAEYEDHIQNRGQPNELYTPAGSAIEVDNFVFVSVRLLNEVRRFVGGEVIHHA